MFQGIKEKYSYKSSGVDIEKADEIIKNISGNFQEQNFKNFAGIFEKEDNCFVSCCDGIGSKIIPLIKYNMPNIIASDLVAMNINDLATLDAKPLFFLDYIAANSLQNGLGEIIKDTINHLKSILNSYNCTLIGGEISEIPSLIKENYFDIAGFLVGQKNDRKKEKIKNKDTIIAFKSNGIHSNGFSLIRKLYEDKKIDEDTFKGTLAPTKIYYSEVSNLYEKNLIKASANITGGGILGNLKRLVDSDFKLKIDYSAISKQEIFEILLKFTDKEECYKVFNMGAGFCVISDINNVDKILSLVPESFVLGEIEC